MLPRRIGVVTNFAASDGRKAVLEAVVARLATMNVATFEVGVPFEAAPFDVRGITRDRAAINGDALPFGVQFVGP